MRLDLRQSLERVFPDEPVDALADQVEAYVRTELADHWTELAAFYDKELKAYDLLRSQFLVFFDGIEAWHATLTANERRLLQLKRPLRDYEIDHFLPKVRTFWLEHCTDYGHAIEMIMAELERGPTEFVSGYLSRPWKVLEQFQHDRNRALVYYALRSQNLSILPDSPIRTSHQRIQALSNAVEDLTASLR